MFTSIAVAKGTADILQREKKKKESMLFLVVKCMTSFTSHQDMIAGIQTAHMNT